ncbi:MAG: amidohydrolase family protein [Planctomycetes bacterium]|nr:amidohydrolase family protein [Planctomycetota bacterium]
MGAELPVERRYEAIRLAAQRAAEKGVTTVHALEGGNRDDEPELRCLMAGDLPVRVVPYPITEDVEWVKSLGLPRIGGCLLLDGAIEAHTAALFEPYADAPGELGKLYHTREELAQFVRSAHDAGLQIAVHAVGERAIQQFLDVLEPVLVRSPRDHRHRIEHFIVPTADQIARVARLGVAVCAQPTFERLWGGEQGGFARRLGPSRMKRTTPLRSLLDAGALVAGGSDSYVSPLDPLLGIHSAVNHPNPAQRLTVPEALRLFTLHAARIAFEDHLKGSLEVGKLADFVVLARNPLVVAPNRLKDLEVLKTYVGGSKVAP